MILFNLFVWMLRPLHIEHNFEMHIGNWLDVKCMTTLIVKHMEELTVFFYVLERTAAMKKLLYAHQVTVAVPVTFAKDVLEG